MQTQKGVIDVSKSKKYGMELRRLRRDKEITLEDLAKEIDCSIVYLSDIERGRRNPPESSKTLRLLRKLGAANLYSEFLALATMARKSIEISMQGKNKDIALMLTALERSCDEGTLDEEKARRIREILHPEGTEE
jgi:transcriptional regulator with XRE-family HTH domain